MAFELLLSATASASYSSSSSSAAAAPSTSSSFSSSSAPPLPHCISKTVCSLLTIRHWKLITYVVFNLDLKELSVCVILQRVI
jgi:hypothetical protein